MAAPELLTPEEVARSCRVTTQTVLNWIEAGKLPAVRLSSRVVRIPQDGFNRFVSARRSERGTANGPTRATAGSAASVRKHARSAVEEEMKRVKPLKSLEELAREQGVSP